MREDCEPAVGKCCTGKASTKLVPFFGMITAWPLALMRPHAISPESCCIPAEALRAVKRLERAANFLCFHGSHLHVFQVLGNVEKGLVE